MYAVLPQPIINMTKSGGGASNAWFVLCKYCASQPWMVVLTAASLKPIATPCWHPELSTPSTHATHPVLFPFWQHEGNVMALTPTTLKEANLAADSAWMVGAT